MRATLQKHGKIIMTIFGVVLMFIFALPTFRTKSDDDRSRARIGLLNGRKVTVDDITGILVFLASDESLFATGNAYSIDGGMTI